MLLVRALVGSSGDINYEEDKHKEQPYDTPKTVEE